MAGPPLHVHALRRLGYAPLRRPAANTWAGQRRRYSNASSSSSDSTTPEWMSLTQQFYSTLSALESQPTNLSPARVHRLHNAAHVAIQSCLEVHRPSEALGIHGALTKSGILGSSPRIDALALKALQATPHQSHQAKVVSCLIAAEGMDGEDTQTAPTELMEFPILRAERTSPAEYFRISVAKNMSLLHTVRELLGPLGVRYALSQMAAVLDCPSLRKEVEVRPLLEISQAVLWHPFAYERPSASWAQHTGRFSASGLDIRRYSASQAKGVASMVAFIEPSRAWCTNALSFVSTLGQGWDALLLRRVAQSLVLPEESHNIFPSSHRYRSRRGVCGPTTQGSLWADPKHSVFGEAQADAQRTPRQRTEYILKRRTKHDILVPDTAFTLTHFHQLEQLAKHREVLITHSVFLELLGVATRLNDPQRFHARRILQYFMHHATTAASVQPSPAKGSQRNRHRNHAAVSRHTQAHHAHVTILGIQDELFILDSCPERFIFGDALSSSLRHTSAKLPEVSSGTLSTILVAKQIERFISASEKGISFFDPTNKELLEELEDESLVEAIVREAERTTEATAHQSREAPLFKSRSRRYWSRLPLVLATTTPAVRAAAYTVDVKMFPPAACQ